MNKKEIQQIFLNLEAEKKISSLQFPETKDENLCVVLFTSQLIKSEEDLNQLLTNQDLKNWKIGFVEKTKDLPEEKLKEEKKDEKENWHYWRIDLISLEYLNEWKRARADFINYKNEENERIAELLKFSNEKILLDLIPVLDSFDISISLLKNEEIKSGIILIRNQLLDILKKYGLEKMDSKIGEKFDPSWQEAVDVENVETEEENVVLRVLSAGYKLHHKILRPAQVIISQKINKKGQ